MLPFSPTIANQIRFLLLTFKDSNFDSVLHDLCQFVDYGSEGSILLLQTSLDLYFRSGVTQDTLLKPSLLAAIFRHLLNRPNFSTVLCESLRSTTINDEFLGALSAELSLSVCEKISVGLALSDSDDLETRTSGQNFCMTQIEELCSNPIPIDSHEKIQNIIIYLSRSEGLAKHLDSFMQMLSLLQLKHNTPLILAPLMVDDLCETNSLRHLDLFYESSENDFDALLAEIEKEMSMADVMKELGYGCTLDASHCKEMLSHFLPLTETTLARILGTIARTHVGLEDSQNAYATFCAALGSNPPADSTWSRSWDSNVLVGSVKQLAPDTNWIHVMENLDHEGFFLPNQEAFSFFMSVYASACQDPFPLHAICGSVWKNGEGQISFLRYAISAPPELFSFAHSARKLANVDVVPGQNFPHGNQAWFCLDLLEVLCQLAERGHAVSVRSMLEYPLKNCPEVLLLGMAHINTAFNLLQYEVLSTILPIIVGKDSQSGIILHLWHVNPNLVVRGLMDVHSADPEAVNRILGLCLELKILPSVLDMTPFSFSIRLAALASRKEQMNLEKWLSNNLSTYKDTFYEECLIFLKEAHLGASQDVPASPFQYSGAVGNVSAETSSIFFKVLQAQAGQDIPNHLSEELKRLQLASMQVNPRMQNGGAPDSSTSDTYPDDIEAEANSYFHQMFSGQLTIDAMVQMLARLRESSEKREQLIFECMIANLFEEYKFFPKYPERQLKIAAVLFGSLIKHQLVTHLTLGIALRGVLDALRKSADSKMFAFGAKALEQFVDRLVEWPQYCNHILQISHLRGTHAEIVAFIERALARISSSHSESNGVNSANDQHQTPNQANLENMEPPESSWKLVGSSTTQPGQQLPSPLQMHQRHQGFLDDRHKYAAGGINPVQQSALSSTTDVVGGNHKITGMQALPTMPSLNSVTGSATPSSSPGFLRPSPSLTSTSMLRQHSYSTGFGSALNIETLVAAAERRDTQIEAPGSEVQDKILFMINNISTSNLEAKAKEFTELLKEEYYPWFAQYMVMKRASIEPNFHDLYLKFLDTVDSKTLNKEIIKTTYENCKVLLRSELIKSSSEERSLLKNLGSWLGKFTIGRNQALRAREIDPKVLIIEAYEKGLMIAVIPFTSKILEPCLGSLAYKPPNPWTMGILGLLAEICALPNLKMNLKFDIEVLFKNLQVDMKSVKPTSLLKDRVREVEGNPDFSNKDIGVSQPQIVSEINPGMVPVINQPEVQPEAANPSHPGSHPHLLPKYTPPLHLAPGLAVDDENISLPIPDRPPTAQGLSQVTPPQPSFPPSQLPTSIPNIRTQIVLNPKLSALGLHMPFQSVVPGALERAIKEIMAPVVQRSVTIAIQTTKELVLKDYAMESERSIYNAAHLMVASLAGCLAHVTCKEPLRVSISNHLRNALQANIASDLLEHGIQLATNDNLDLGCAVVEQGATEKALQTIDGEIAAQLAMRRKHREGVGSTYFDASTYTQGPMSVVPEALRPKPGRLSLPQQRVYEDFVKIPWQNQPTHNSTTMPAGPPTSSVGSSLVRAYGPTSGQLNPGVYSSVQGGPGFSTVGQPLDLVADEMDPNSLHLISSSPHGTTDSASVTPKGSENCTLAASIPSSTAPPELNPVERANAAMDSGATTQPLPATSTTERTGSSTSEPLLSTGDALEKYQVLALKLETLVTKDGRDSDIQGVISEVPEIIRKCVSRDEAALAIAQKVFKSLYEDASNNIHVGAHLAILGAIRDACKLAVKELTSWVIYSDEERKFNREITVGLIRYELLNLAEYNMHMAKLIDGGRNKGATEFAISLLQTLVVQEQGVSVSEMHNLVDALAKLAIRPGSPESLQQLVEIARNPTANAASLLGFTTAKDEKNRQSRDKKVPPSRSLTNREDYNDNEPIAADSAGYREQVSSLFSDWCQICDLATNDASLTRYVSQLQQTGLYKGDEERFFRNLTEIALLHCLSFDVVGLASLSLQSPLSFYAIDRYSELVSTILKCSMEQGSKVALLSKILAVTVRVIQKDAEEKKTAFNPRPYYRLFINWLSVFGSSDPVLDGANLQMLMAFATHFLAVQPLKVPGFCYAWLQLVSNRSFMPKLLYGNNQKGWPSFQRLVVALFKFMEPYLRNAELSEAVHCLYKGTLRVLLVLLHDFPEFLCNYHFSFCDVIPPSCIQMRNVILSAFPRNMRLPDPSTPNLKIDLLAEISQSPSILSDVDAALKAKQMKTDIDEYLKTRQGSSFLQELKQRLLVSKAEANLTGTNYNVPLINSLVLYVGMQAIQQLQTKTPTQSQITHMAPMDIFLVGAAMDIFQHLIGDLDTEGRYLFLNAVANQLRYPNNHTHYFSFVLLYLFAEATHETIQEQITRVLLERLIVNRPHPWGLLITFIELIKNPRYNFWVRSFTRIAPEIEKLFESVSRSCGGPKSMDESLISSGISDSVH